MSIERNLLEKINDFVLDKHLTICEFEMETEIYETFLEVRELLTQPEQEPFIFKDRKLTGSLIVHDDMYKKGYAQAELDLKREPLNESKISAIWGDSDYDVSIVRAIEKEHGITGVEEC
jgi:hypothetical protein